MSVLLPGDTDIDLTYIWSFCPNLQIYIFRMYIGLLRFDLLSAIHQEAQDFFYKCLTVHKIIFIRRFTLV